MRTCDIIIPAYNSAHVLLLTLTALQDQEIPPGWQVGVIISDDGSTDETEFLISNLKFEISNSWQKPIFLPGDHTGAAGARNRALAASQADVVLFLGADILLRPGSLAAHLHLHSKEHENIAALGMVRWDPRLKPTALMEWMVHGGPQNDFDSLLGAATANPTHFFFGSHVSVMRSVLPSGGFPIEYKSYGWEDLDLGRQLAARGVRLTVLHEAVGLHRHSYAAVDILRRQRHVGHGIGIYQLRYPTVQIAPPRTRSRTIKARLYSITGASWAMRVLLQIIGSRWSMPRLFSLAAAAEYWLGVVDYDHLEGAKRG